MVFFGVTTDLPCGTLTLSDATDGNDHQTGYRIRARYPLWNLAGIREIEKSEQLFKKKVKNKENEIL